MSEFTPRVANLSATGARQVMSVSEVHGMMVKDKRESWGLWQSGDTLQSKAVTYLPANPVTWEYRPSVAKSFKLFLEVGEYNCLYAIS